MRVDVSSSGVIQAIQDAVSAMETSENLRASLVYDWTRVMYNSWGCQEPISTLATDFSRFGPAYTKIGAGGKRKRCRKHYSNWLVSTDGGATWKVKSYPTEVCVDDKN
jgi:hypothetical protein